MQTRILDNGDLEISADATERVDLADVIRAGGYWHAEMHMADCLHESYDFVRPESIAAMTESPILCAADDIDYPGDGQPTPRADAVVWWFPNYQIIDPWDALSETGRVVFTRASDAS
jgi:hypothetical protein